jgi:photosystem II stability/assembly factor-like uncharacterized protein
MASKLSPRTKVAATVITVAIAGSSSIAVSAAATNKAATATKAPKTVTATKITRPPGTLASGTRVRPAAIFSQRVFTDGKHGFALASVAGADYPVATSDGGKTWKTDGPALHLHAAQAPLAVTFIGAVSRKTIFAWGGGQVIDTTNDGGKHWYRALFQGAPVAVAQDLQRHLNAFVGSSSGTGTVRYVSRDGGRTWHR